MTKRFLILMQSVALSLLCGVSSAVPASNELVADFDSFSEGSPGTQFVDDGILFSELDNDAVGRFSADSRAGASAFPQMTLPNTLSTFGFAPGPAGGFSRLRSFRVTPPSLATAASVDLFLSLHPEVVDRRFQVEALLNNRVVATTSVLAGTGSPFPNGGEYHNLTIEAHRFDSLKLSATDLAGNPSYTLAAFDNVYIQLVPEPSCIALLLCGCCWGRLTTRSPRR